MLFRTTATLLLPVLLSFAPLFGQEAPTGDAGDSVSTLESLAEAIHDPRPATQIKKDNAMIRAVLAKDVEAVRTALKNGANVDAQFLDTDAFLERGRTGYTALMLASVAGHTDMVNFLIEQKANLKLECEGRTSLYMAVEARKYGVATTLERAGAGDSKKIRTTLELLRAACHGFEMKDGEGYPLYPGAIRDPDFAPPEGLREVQEHTEEHANDPKDAIGIAVALKHGADINSADPNGYTALMYAANLGLIENVKVLLANKADATLTTKDGETALSLAERPNSSVARVGRRQVVELLKAHLAAKK